MPQAAAFIAAAFETAIVAVVSTVSASAGAALANSAFIAVAGTAVGWGSVAALSALTISQPKLGAGAGTMVDFKADPQAPIPYVVGETAVAGNIVFAQVAGGSNKYLNYAAVLSGAGPVEAITGFTANDQAVSFSADQGEGAVGYYQNRMWWTAQLGDDNPGYLHWASHGSKDTPGDHAGLPAEWTSDHTLPGMAAFLWAMEYDAAKYAAGPPKPLVAGRWVKVWDPRLDSTYPGGSGPCRALDESTYVWSRNGPLHGLTWCLGRWQNGKRILGAGIPVSGIDVAAFVEAANISDANGWYCDGQVTSADDKWEVLKGFLQAGGAKPIKLGARVSCIVNTPRVSLATITGADVVGEASITGGQSRRTRINAIWPKYREPAQGYELVTPDEPVAVSAYETIDGERRSREVQYPLVQSATQAAQLARYDIENAREFGPVVLPCKPRWMGYKPGDCITATEPEWGLNGQKLLIVTRQRDPLTMQVTLTCVSETDGKHPFALGQTAEPPSTPRLTGVDAGYIEQPQFDVWDIAPIDLEGDDGTKTPALAITGEIENPYATSLVIELQRPTEAAPFDEDGPWVLYDETPAPSGADNAIIVRGLASGATYHVAISYRSIRGFVGPRLSFGPFTVGSLVVTNLGDLTAAAIKETQDRIDAIARRSQIDIATIQASTKNQLEALKNQLAGLDGRPLGPLVDEHTAQIADLHLQADGLEADLLIEVAARQTADALEVTARETFYTDYSGFRSTTQSTLISQAGLLSTLSADQTSLSTDYAGFKSATNVTLAALSTDQLSTSTVLTSLNSSFLTFVSTTTSALTTLTNAQGSTATDLAALTTSFGSFSASASTTLTAHTDALSSLTAWQADMQSDFDAFKASATLQLSTLTTGAGSTSALLATLSSSFDDYVAETALTLIAYASDLETLAATQTTLNSNFGTFSASVASTLTALSNAQSSTAADLVTLRADHDGLEATATAGISANASDIAVLADAHTGLATDFDGYTATTDASLSALSTAQGAQGTALTAVQAQADNLSAAVTEQADAIADAAGKLALARFEVIAAASGGRPTKLGLYSDSDGGSAIALQAAQIYFGQDGYYDDATDTFNVEGSAARLTWGGPFGSDNLGLWYGDKSIAITSATKANSAGGRSYFELSTVTPLPVPGGGGGGGGGVAVAGATTFGPGVSGSSWTTIGSVTLAIWAADGVWQFDGGVISALTDSSPFTDWAGEWRIIESGQSTALASGTFGQPYTGGGAVVGDFDVGDMAGDHTALAGPGSVTVNFQLRRTSGSQVLTATTGGFGARWAAS